MPRIQYNGIAQGGASLPTADPSDVIDGVAPDAFLTTSVAGNGQVSTAAAARLLMFPVTAFMGASAGWTDVDGVGTADASGTDYDLVIGTGETGASETYPTADHPRLHRDVSSLTGAEADWSVTFRVGAFTGGGSGRLFVAVGKADDSAGVQVLVEPGAGTVELGSWVSVSYTAAGTAAGAVPLNGTGWVRMLCRGGVVSAQWCTGTSSEPSSTAWVSVAGTVSVAGIIPARLSLYLAQWAGTGLSASVDDVRVRVGA